MPGCLLAPKSRLKVLSTESGVLLVESELPDGEACATGDD
jgi:hypothetical protein